MTKNVAASTEVFHWTIEQYHRLAEANILTDDDKTELLDGQIIYMSPIEKLHAAAVRRLDKLLQKTVGDAFLISTQNPISIFFNDSEPQPDLVLLKPKADFYASNHPAPDDIYLVIEVADSTLDKDRALKIPIYAKAGIQECWLINLIDQNIEVYTEPSPKGYRNMQIRQEGEWIESAVTGRILVDQVLK